MATRFLSQRDRNTFTTINRELVGSPKDSKDGVVNQTCVLYRISAADTITNLYGEAAAGKTYLPGVKLPCLVQAEDLISIQMSLGLILCKQFNFGLKENILQSLG